jgi:hypothetical protein
MISIPFNPPTGESAATTLGLSGTPELTRWDPDATPAIKYRDYPDSYVASLSPGEGYYVNLSSAAAVDGSSGYTTLTGSDFEILLKDNWNQIGNPFPANVDWDNVMVRIGSGTPMTMASAIINGYVISGPWKYSNGSHVSAVILEPWLGYWVRVSTDLYLIIPHP